MATAVEIYLACDEVKNYFLILTAFVGNSPIPLVFVNK